MISFERLVQSKSEIEEKIHYRFKVERLLFMAFVHRSYVNEHKEVREHNERLEFLGDSVLGLIIAEYLYERFPQHAEGQLSQLRSRIVDASSCVQFFQKLGLGQYILLGKGEALSEGRGKGSIYADVFEALIAAIYLDGGFVCAKKFFFDHFSVDLDAVSNNPYRNFKAELQDYSQKKFQKLPFYKILKEVGPDHAKIFHVAVIVGDQMIAEGEGPSKKEAEQKAAENALDTLHKKIQENSDEQS